MSTQFPQTYSDQFSDCQDSNDCDQGELSWFWAVLNSVIAI